MLGKLAFSLIRLLRFLRMDNLYLHEVPYDYCLPPHKNAFRRYELHLDRPDYGLQPLTYLFGDLWVPLRACTKGRAI